MTRRVVMFVGLVVLVAGIMLAFTVYQLDIFNAPAGQQIGTWTGSVEVLAVEGNWAKVRMIGWAPRAAVAPDAPEGIRLEGSPGDGLWVRDVQVRTSVWGYMTVTGWITNATGKNLEFVALEAVLLKANGEMVDLFPGMIGALVDGATKAFSIDIPLPYSPFFKVVLQYTSGF